MSGQVYNDLMSVFHQRTGVIQNTVKFFREQQSLNLSTARSCLSIGPGDGELDMPILPLMRNLETYTAVEPNPASCHKLRSIFENQRVTAQIHEQLWQTWYDDGGNTQRYDVIFILHVIYVIPDPHVLLAACRQLLTPGGQVLVGFCDFSPATTIGRITNHFTDKRPYTLENLMRDFKIAGISTFDKCTLEMPFDLTGCDTLCLDMLMFMCFMKYPNDSKRTDVEDLIRRMHPDEVGVYRAHMTSYGPTDDHVMRD